MKTQMEHLITCAEKLLDAVDMMNDGPDDSDKAYAYARLAEAHEAAKEWRRQYLEQMREVIDVGF